MKCLLPFLLLLVSSSCVATTGDLANLSEQFTASLQTLDAEVQEAQASGEDTSVAFDKAIEDMGAAVGGTVAVIEGRVGEVAAGMAALTAKAASGPSGWLEILATMGGVAAAGGVGLHKYRNGTRERDIEAANKA